jgi:serine/threonine protein kinase
MRGAAPGAEERLTRDAADLLARMLAWAPEERLHASDALLHPYFLRAVDDAEDAAFADAQARGAHGKRRRHRERRSIGQADGPTSTP